MAFGSSMFRAAPIHRERDREVDARDAHHGRDADLNNEVMYMCLARVNPVTFCVEINQCVGCTKSFLGDDAAVLARSSG